MHIEYTHVHNDKTLDRETVVHRINISIIF